MTKTFLGEFIFENWRIDIPIDPVASALRVASIGAVIVEKMRNSFIAQVGYEFDDGQILT